MIFRDVTYSSQEACTGEISAAFPDIMESFAEQSGDCLTFAGAGITGANVETEAGRWFCMTVGKRGESLQEALHHAVMVEVVDGKQIQIPREKWEAAPVLHTADVTAAEYRKRREQV